MTPKFQILKDGADITGNFTDRLISLDLTDHAGNQTDDLSITLDDRDFAIELPERKAKLQILLGYAESGLADMGVYEVVNIRGEGPPFQITVTAKSASMEGQGKTHRTKKYGQGKKLKDVVQEAASRMGYSAQVDEKLGSEQFSEEKPLHQTEESDFHFLARLARDRSALFAVKNGKMIFKPRADGKSGDGQDMQAVVLTLSDLLAYSFNLENRARYDKVKAPHYDRDAAQRQYEEAGGGSSGGQSLSEFWLKHVYPDKDQAKLAAEAKLKELRRREGDISVEITGDPMIVAAGTVTLMTGRDGLDGEWDISTVKHSLSGEGYRTTIEANAKTSVSK